MVTTTTNYEKQGQVLQDKLDRKHAENYDGRCALVREDDNVCNKCLQYYDQDPKARTKYGVAHAPVCSMSTTHQLNDDMQTDWWYDLPPEEQANYKVAKDPVYWSYTRLRDLNEPDKPWEPSWYQIEPLRCSSRRLLLLWGRQLGKTEIIAVKSLFYMDTHKDFKIVVVCPYATQVNEIYTRMLDLVRNSPELSERLIRKRENPVHELKFDNGSRVRLFTAGVQTGKGGTDVRGQPADLLVMDEADYLDDKTIVSIFATLIRAKNPRIFVSSTPTGRRGKFYQWATDPSHGFRKIHYTSMEAPEWDEEMELFYRKTYSAAYFAHEYMAEFGEMEAGVFRKQDIEAAVHMYDISDPVPQEDEFYVMGVDWNSTGVGGVIVIVGYNKITQKFRMAYKEVVDPAQFTQLYTVDRIVQLNRIWNPEYIYVDYGHGETQVELLHQYGLDDRATKLHRKVKGVPMQGNIEIRDPRTKKLVKKQSKTLMVELAVARAEAGQIMLPKTEDHREGLIGQMREFEVLRIGRRGQKVYTGDNEHLLIAWMLCIMGFVLEFSDITKVRTVSQVVLADSNYNRIMKVKRDAKAARRAVKARNRLMPVSRTDSGPKLNLVDAINYAGRGLPPGFKKRTPPNLGRGGGRTW